MRYTFLSLIVFICFFDAHTQSLKGFTLGEYHPQALLSIDGITSMVLYDNVTVGGLDGQIGIGVFNNEEIIYSISFSQPIKNSFDSVYISKKRFDIFLNDIESFYNISFIKSEEVNSDNRIYNYTCYKGEVKYNIRTVKYYKGESVRFDFSMTRIDLKDDIKILKNSKRKGDF